MSLPALLVILTAADPLAAARDHVNHGRYDEAAEAYEHAASGGAASHAIAMGLSRVRIETGRYDEAETIVAAEANRAPANPDLLARRGELRLIRGDWTAALKEAEEALDLDEEHAAAHAVKARALTETGRIAEASDEYRWFVRHYNRNQPQDAETLLQVARGSLQYARWKRANATFHTVLNELCPDVTKAEPDDWRSLALSGELLLEKYNTAQGLPELKRALAKNANAASVHSALGMAAFEEHDVETAAERAEAALRINPALVEALGLRADLAIVAGELGAARESLQRALAVNPNDQETLGRVAAIDILETSADGFIEALEAIEAGDSGKVDAATALGAILAPLLERNPKPGAFLTRLAATLERRRLYGPAERAYEAAIRVMPELSGPQVSLALLTMRAGDFRRGKQMLDAAFKADPFHVRVSNMRKVVGLLESYESLETPHFVVRFDPAKDRVLAELAAESLEGDYPELTQEFGFEPPEKTVVELFHAGRGQSGRAWFSARMVGLPWLQTVGASTGLMIAVASPTSGPDYNWARVLRHEFTHVITLQQTEFRIPHWYTEALAVRSEGFPRPDEWNALLRERVPEGRLRTLDELNAAFIRPGSADDWQFAYCQSLLYAEHLDEQFGPDVHRRLLDAYSRGLPTRKALAEATDASADEFDEGYREHLAAVAETLGPAISKETSPGVEEALKAARAAVRERKASEAIASLEPALDRESPDPRVLELLGRLRYAIGDTAEAAELFALGRARYPSDRSWLRLQVASLLKGGDSPELRPLLEELTNSDADDALAAKKLAETSAAESDWSACRRWSVRALHVTPHDPALHELLAEACDRLGETERSAKARRHAALLKSAPGGNDEASQ